MRNTIRTIVVCASIFAGAGSAFAGFDQGFDFDKYLQDVESGTTLYER